MTGKEDRAISEYFIENAFPTEKQEQLVISALEEAEGGLRKSDLTGYCNISQKALEHTLHMLRIHKMVYREENRFYRSMVPYRYPKAYYNAVKQTKYEELDVMDQYAETEECLSRFIVSALNDDTACDCGKCANCLGRDILSNLEVPDIDEIIEIQEELNALYIAIPPRKRWPETNTLDNKLKISIPNEEGLALSKYGETGFGEMVKYDKYTAHIFRRELVKKSAIVINEKLHGQDYYAVTSVPSFSNSQVEMFARQVAKEIGLPYIQLLEKVPGQTAKMKNMQNSFYQYKNAIASFKKKDGIEVPKRIILIDDVVDSRWTLTVCGRLLTANGAERVVPFCLADSSLALGD
jgi:ATP-dependent DNA helicase RecQ